MHFWRSHTFLLKAAIVELESERIDLEQKVSAMQEAEEKMSQWVLILSIIVVSIVSIVIIAIVIVIIIVIIIFIILVDNMNIMMFTRTKSALQPLLSEVSTRTAELRNFESAINAKKQELERVSKKVEEVTSTLRYLKQISWSVDMYKVDFFWPIACSDPLNPLFPFATPVIKTSLIVYSDLDNKSTLIGGNSPALLALLAGTTSVYTFYLDFRNRTQPRLIHLCKFHEFISSTQTRGWSFKKLGSLILFLQLRQEAYIFKKTRLSDLQPGRWKPTGGQLPRRKGFFLSSVIRHLSSVILSSTFYNLTGPIVPNL